MENYKFKITLPSGELRRLRFRTTPNWSEFFESISSIAFFGKNPQEFFVQYRDEEGDPISICSQPEWTEALNILSKDDIKRITVVSKDQLKQELKTFPRITVNIDDKPLEITVKEILEKVFVHADSFVNQLPGFLETLVEEIKKIQLHHIVNTESKKKDETQSSSLEFQLPTKLHSTFFGFPHNPQNQRHGQWKRHHHHHHRPEQQPHFRCPFHLNRFGFRFFEEKNYQAARDCFEQLTKICPGDTFASYNLACAHALFSTRIQDPVLKEEVQQNALNSLRHAISIGYTNVAHMEQDEDFESIRDRPEFQQIVRQLKNSTEETQLQAPIPIQQIRQKEVKPEPQLETEVGPIVIKKQIEDNFVAIPFSIQQPTQEDSSNESEHLVFKQFESELKQLLDMGFLDSNKNLELLLQNNGDVFQVISVLLN